MIRGLGYLGMKYVHMEKQDIEYQKHKYKYVLTASKPHETTWELLHKFIRFKNSLVIAELQMDSMWNVYGKSTFFNIYCRNMLKIYK